MITKDELEREIAEMKTRLAETEERLFLIRFFDPEIVKIEGDTLCIENAKCPCEWKVKDRRGSGFLASSETQFFLYAPREFAETVDRVLDVYGVKKIRGIFQTYDHEGVPQRITLSVEEYAAKAKQPGFRYIGPCSIYLSIPGKLEWIAKKRT